MATQVDVIKSLVQSLISAGKAGTTGSDALTSFLNTYGLSNYAALKTKFVDAMSGYSSAQSFLENVCGIRVNNTDTGAITGSDAGGSTTKTADSIIPEITAAVELTEAEYNSFTKDGVTFKFTYSDTFGSSTSSAFNNDKDVYLTKQRLVTRALYNWWIPESLSLIKESLGIDLSGTQIDVNFYSAGGYYSYEAPLKIETTSDMGTASKITFNINMYYLSNITESDLNGSLSSTPDYAIKLPSGSGVSSYGFSETISYYSRWTNYFDRIMLMGLSEIALRANIPYFYELPEEIQGGLRKLVNGFDDGGIKKSASTTTNGVAASTSDGYALLRFLARNYAGIEYNDDGTAVTVTSDYVHSSIPSNYVSYDSNVVTITGAGRTSPLNISGNESGNVIVGTSGADTIDGKVGNDTLTGGGGSDVFIYTAGEGNDVITDYTAGELVSIVGSNFTSSVNGNDVILNTSIGGGSLTLKNSVGKAINLNDAMTLIQGSANADNLTGTAKADYMRGNAGNDVLNGNAGNDTLNGEAGNDTLAGGAGADVFVYASGGGNDVITDYSSGQDSIKLTSGSITRSSLKGNDVVLAIGTGSITVKNAKGQQITVIDSKGNSTSKVYGTSTTTSTTLTVTNSTKSPVTAASTVKNINASTRTTAVKITGNSLANSIVGGSGNDSINGGAGADTINGGKGNDTLTGGAGNDVFIYASGQGNDVITDYTANQDKIKITGAKISKTSVSGNDVILSVSSGSIRVKNGKGKKLSIYNNATSLTNTVIGSASSSTTKSGTSSTLLTVTNSTKSPVTVGSAIKTINASNRTTAVKITGNALANSIVGGKGADTLIGGKGNDTLTGGAGANVFVYANGDGNDVITDYKATDKITITGGSYTRSTVGNDVRIKVGTGSITLKNAKGKSVTINNSRAFEERWFLDNSECGMRNDELSSILDNKSSDIVIDSKHDNAANFLQKTLTTLTSNKKDK